MKQIMFDLLLCSAAMHSRFAGIIPLFFQWFARLLNTLKIPRIGPNAALSPADEMGVTSTKPWMQELVGNWLLSRGPESSVVKCGNTRHPEVKQELLDYKGDTFKWEVKGHGLCTYSGGLERVRKMPVQVT